MRRLSPLIVLGALLAVLHALPASADEDQPRRGQGWWGDLDRGDFVDLADIVVDPRPFSGRELTFFAILRGHDDVFVPQGTIFTRRKYTNLSIWPDGTPVWEQSAYQKDEFPFLYIQTTHAQRDEIVRLPRFTRIEITGRIRSIVRDRPFIEVTAWRETSHRLGRDVVDAMAWGDIYARGAKIELAAAKYQEALAVDLPPLYDMAIRKRAADALRRLGYPQYADEIESGETLGGTEMPQPKATAGEPAMPGFAPPGAGPVPGDSDPGFAPVEPGVGFAPPDAADTGTQPAVPGENPFFSDDLPGVPHGATGNPTPGASRPDRPAAAAPRPASGNPFLGDDLPGVPRGVQTVPPRAPSGAAVPAAAPGAAPEAAAPSEPSGRSTPRPVLPPSRRPRLAGFK